MKWKFHFQRKAVGLRSLSERVTKLEHVLREYAKTEPRLAEILKQYAL